MPADHHLIFRESEAEELREAVGVPRDGLIERSGLQTVKLREVAVEHGLLAANGVDHAHQLSC